jgi:hypothetical protein
MDDAAFVAYVLNNAPRYEIESLEKIVIGLNSNIASRRWGPRFELVSEIAFVSQMPSAVFRIHPKVSQERRRLLATRISRGRATSVSLLLNGASQFAEG